MNVNSDYKLHQGLILSTIDDRRAQSLFVNEWESSDAGNNNNKQLRNLGKDGGGGEEQ